MPSRARASFARCSLATSAVWLASFACAPPSPDGDFKGSASQADARDIYLGPRSPCSTGPPYAWDTDFPEGPSQSSAPECVPRCAGGVALYWGAGGANAPSMDAVPSGGCAYHGEACTMIAVRPSCRPDNDRGQALRFVCRCEHFAWSCSSAYFGGGASVCELDGGDAGSVTDAALDK